MATFHKDASLTGCIAGRDHIMNRTNATAATAIAAKATWAIVAALLLTSAAMTTSIAAETVVHVGLVRSITSGVTLDAIEKGYFKEVGIKVETDPLDTSANSIALLSQNKFDLIEGGISAGYFNGLEKDLPITMVMDRVSTPIGHNLMLRPDLAGQITDVKQLKGKVIGTNGAGSVSTYEIGKLLELGGLTIKDVELKILPFPQYAIAFANKAIDAALVIPPWTPQYAADKIAVPFLDSDKLIKPTPMTIAVVMMNTDWSKKNTEVARNYFVAYMRAVRDYCQAFHNGPSRKEFVDMLVRTGAETRPQILNDPKAWPARSAAGSINVASMLDMQDWYVANKFSTAKFPAERLVDSTFADYAVKKLGPFVVDNKDSKFEGCR
jgi:NitT/TauT family transport system substrate-binding protein